jgi:menaquinol-cytochrome c reductase iron-sulfur subunit
MGTMNSDEAPAAADYGGSRRTLLSWAIYGLGAVIGAALALPAIGYLFSAPRPKRPERWTGIADVAKLAVDAPVEIAFRRNRTDGWKLISEKSTAWVVRKAGGVVAFGPQCTHLGCAYRWDESANHFLCPCHTSVFSIDGAVISGPAPRPLDRYETRIEGGRLLIGRLESPAERQA